MPATRSPRPITVSNTSSQRPWPDSRWPGWRRGLPEEALGIGALIERYKEVQHDFHRGVILPVGDEPSGRSWTGFQSVDGERGYLIFFREQNPDRKARIETWLPENSKVRLTPVLGSGKAAVQKTGRRGTLEVELPAPNDYTMYRYELIR